MIYRYLLLTFFLFGCSSVETVETSELADPAKENSEIQPPGPMPTKYDGYVGVNLDTIIAKGDSQFLAGRYSEALVQYRNVIELQKSTPHGKTAEALYKAGMCHELMGDDAKAIATYQDALKRKKDLTFELGQMEIPARLAMAYMRIGQLKTSKNYFLKAEKGLARLRANLANYENKSQWLAQILYGMGFISAQIKDDRNFDDTIHSIQHAQSYLLFSMEINDPKWSPLAGQELEKLYKVAYENIENMKEDPSKDAVAAKRTLQEKQKKMGYILLDQISNLYDQVMPEVENTYLKETLARIATTEKAIETLVKSRPVGEGLTEEAKKFESPKREGRIKDD